VWLAIAVITKSSGFANTKGWKCGPCMFTCIDRVALTQIFGAPFKGENDVVLYVFIRDGEVPQFWNDSGIVPSVCGNSKKINFDGPIQRGELTYVAETEFSRKVQQPDHALVISD